MKGGVRIMAMDPKKKGEIALAILRDKARKEGIRVFPDAFERDLGNLSSATGISKNELKKFYEEEYQLLFDEIFSEKD